MHSLDANDWFAPRHIGPSPDERDAMLEAIGARSLDALIDEAIPAAIRLKRPLNLPEAESEHQYLRRLTHVARRNKTFRSYIGLGYHDTITPSVILRMVMENPGWYTPYTRIKPRLRRVASSHCSISSRWWRTERGWSGQRIATRRGDSRGGAMTLLHRVRTNKAAGRGRARFPRQRPVPASDDRGCARPRGAARHRCPDRPVEGMTFDARSGRTAFGVLLQYPDESGLVQDLATS